MIGGLVRINADVLMDQQRVNRRCHGPRDRIFADRTVVGGRPDRHATSVDAQLFEVGGETHTTALPMRGLRAAPVGDDECLLADGKKNLKAAFVLF